MTRERTSNPTSDAGPGALADTPPGARSEAPPPPPPSGEESTSAQRRALGVMALIAVFGIARLAMPVGIGVLLGTLAAFLLQPMYARLLRRARRPGIAALVCTLVAGAGVLSALGAMGYLLIGRGVLIGQSVLASLGPGGEGRRVAGRLTHQLGRLHLTPDEVLVRAQGAASDLTARAARLAADVAGFTLHGLLGLFFMLLTVHYILRNWRLLERRAELVLPLAPHHTRELFDEFRRVGRSVLLGTILTGAAQGVLAAVGYHLTGVPEAAFLGAATAVASLVPAVGTLLVWVPAGLYLMAEGHVTAGIVELAYGALIVVGLSDYVIRPMLVRGEGETPALLTFIALFGGIEAFGLIGLVLGPVIMALGLALLRTYQEERVRESRRITPAAAPRPAGPGPAAP